MIKKPDLRIDTEFYDDNFNGLDIPQVIRVTTSLSQTFIKEGLADQAVSQAALAIQRIDKVVSQRLFDNFLWCWSCLKQFTNKPGSPQSITFSTKHQKNETLLIRNVASQEECLLIDNSEHRGIRRQKNQLHKPQGSEIDWLEQQRRNIKSKSILRGLGYPRAPGLGRNNYERAKLLKEIVDKLKHGKSSVTTLLGRMEEQRQNQFLHHKLDKIEKFMEEVQAGWQPRSSSLLPKDQGDPSMSKNKQNNRAEEIQQKLKRQLSEVRKQMQGIREQNERILKEEQWKKTQLLKISQTRDQITQHYETLKMQINRLQWEKQQNQQRNFYLQNELHAQSIRRSQHQEHIAMLTQRLSQTQNQHHRARQALYRSTSRQIVPVQSNPFGYSTFATSHRNSEVVVNWEQSQSPIGQVGTIVVSQEARQKADEWACC